MISKTALEELLKRYEDDRDTVDFIFGCILSFERYHASVIEMELSAALYSPGLIGSDDYEAMVTSKDGLRTAAHNSVIGNINALNRLAEKSGIPPVYGGTVSEAHPYRRQIADAVIEYMQDIIKNRR